MGLMEMLIRRSNELTQKRIAVIGSGIAGISAAWYLRQEYHVTLFEKRSRLGGHTHTIVVQDPRSGATPVDTGFIVCNDRTYPYFHRFLEELSVPVRSADMSFGYYDESTGFSYGATSLQGLVPSLRHLFNRQYMGMWRALPKFNRNALRDLEEGHLKGLTLREYLKERKVPKSFIELFLVPMGAAIWSSGDDVLLDTPAETFLAFFKNHGLLTILDRPQWQTVVGGSHSYLKAFTSQFHGDIRLSTGVRSVRRTADGVLIASEQGEQQERFDAVVFACHADQILPMLLDASAQENALFSPWRYHSNATILHTDVSYLPPNKRTWASWNYRRECGERGSEPLSVTYHMNRLQGLDSAKEYCVTLNPRKEISKQEIIKELHYMHPMYTLDSVATQQEIYQHSGSNRTFYVGSYLGWGFHEDAIRSSYQTVTRLLGTSGQDYFRRAQAEAVSVFQESPNAF